MKRILSIIIAFIIAISILGVFPAKIQGANQDSLINYIEGQLVVSIEKDYDFSIQSTCEIINDQVSVMETNGFKVIDSILDSYIEFGSQSFDGVGFSVQNYDNSFTNQIIEDMGYVSLVEYSKEYESLEKAIDKLRTTLEQNGLKVKYVEPNYVVEAFEDFTISMHRNQRWHYNMINAPSAWTITTGSRDVRIAVLDTGIDHNHQNLRNIVDTSLGASYVGGNTMDVRGHGTHVAGTIASYGSVSGVADNITLIPVKVLGDNGRGTSYAVQQGILYASSINADVINMSLGGFGFSSGMNNACQVAAARGSVLVAASGNDGRSSIAYPAAYSSVISVGAVNSNRQRANFSNYGDGLDLMAPGVSIYSTTPGNGYSSYSGTSMAAPHVAGVVGLMRSVNKNITVNTIRSILTSTAQNAGSRTYFGHGIVDAYAAVIQSGGSIPEPSSTKTTLTTDKTIYNRGDTVSSTALITDQTGKLLQGATVRFTFTRPNNTSFNQTATTNSSGVATLSIPSTSSTAFGTYTIRADTSLSGYESSFATTTIRFEESTLIAHYKFDELNGTNAQDSTGISGNATLANGAILVSGLQGNSVKLNGANEYVQLPNGIVRNVSDFTISKWVKLDSLNAWQRIFDFGNNTDVNMFLTPSSSAGNLRFAIKNGGSEQRINGPSSIPTGRWVHVAVTLSNSTGILYVDGREVGRNSNITIKPSDLGTTSNNYIGKSQYQDPYLNGQIDDFRIYNYALEAAEIIDLANVNISAPAFITGDLNGDDRIDSTDIVLLRRYILGIINEFPYPEGINAADVNADGVIDSSDYILLRRYLLGLITEFP
ncbi:UNVERIFIED_CONTAM: subtilisin family serine protease [Acetivibrio alkalicellulosi]